MFLSHLWELSELLGLLYRFICDLFSFSFFCLFLFCLWLLFYNRKLFIASMFRFATFWLIEVPSLHCPFSSGHTQIFTLLSSIISISPTTRYILKDGYYQKVSPFKFLNMIILFCFFLIDLLEQKLDFNFYTDPIAITYLRH